MMGALSISPTEVRWTFHLVSIHGTQSPRKTSHADDALTELRPPGAEPSAFQSRTQDSSVLELRTLGCYHTDKAQKRLTCKRDALIHFETWNNVPDRILPLA